MLVEFFQTNSSANGHCTACRNWKSNVLWEVLLDLLHVILVHTRFAAFKGPYVDHIVTPQGSTGSSIFFDIKWKPIFFWFQIQNFSLKFFVVLEIWQKCEFIPVNNLLCVFISASSPGVHTFFCLWRVNKKLPQHETSQNAFQRSRSIN